MVKFQQRYEKRQSREKHTAEPVQFGAIEALFRSFDPLGLRLGTVQTLMRACHSAFYPMTTPPSSSRDKKHSLRASIRKELHRTSKESQVHVPLLPETVRRPCAKSERRAARVVALIRNPPYRRALPHTCLRKCPPTPRFEKGGQSR